MGVVAVDFVKKHVPNFVPLFRGVFGAHNDAAVGARGAGVNRAVFRVFGVLPHPRGADGSGNEEEDGDDVFFHCAILGLSKRDMIQNDTPHGKLKNEKFFFVFFVHFLCSLLFKFEHAKEHKKNLCSLCSFLCSLWFNSNT